MNRLIVIALSAIFSMGVLAQFSGRITPPGADEPREAAAVAMPSAMRVEEPAGDGQTLIRRDRYGQFHLDGRVNGSDAAFLVDTGADIVALTEETARYAGLPIDSSDYAPILRTASGTGMGAHYTAGEIVLAGRHFRDVDVVVVEGLGTNLLGQSMLRRLGRVELRGDNMVIERD